MVTITVRFFHYPSHNEMFELTDLDPDATKAGALRAKVEDWLASKEECPMRVFVRWYVKVMAGGRKRSVEITDKDAGASLSSLGFEDYSEVLLEGPLTDEKKYLESALAVLGVRMRQQNFQLWSAIQRMEERQLLNSLMIAMNPLIILESIVRQTLNTDEAKSFGCICNVLTVQKEEVKVRLSACSEEVLAYRKLQDAAKSEYERLLKWVSLVLSAQDEEVKARLAIIKEGALSYRQLLDTAQLEYQRFFPFSIDPSTPHPGVTLEGRHTAVRTAILDILGKPGDEGWVTFRSSKPLSPSNHRWGVKLHLKNNRFSYASHVALGMLPKLSAVEAATMDRKFIEELGGWSLSYDADNRTFSFDGDWDCRAVTFRDGDVMGFDYNFTNKTLTLSCNGQKAVGRIWKSRNCDELYPAFTLSDIPNEKVSFVMHP